MKIDSPEELTVLAREFNRMNIQVRELLSNRTTLLAGIAHDLRTPLTQIQLALAMLPDEGGDPKLMKSIQNDLGVINRLIGETLSINLELEEGEAVFRPFYRLEKSRGSKTGGSGLGLAIVRQLADANKWGVRLLPHPGGGTCAELTIPRT